MHIHIYRHHHPDHLGPVTWCHILLSFKDLLLFTLALLLLLPVFDVLGGLHASQLTCFGTHPSKALFCLFYRIWHICNCLKKLWCAVVGLLRVRLSKVSKPTCTS